MPTSLSKSRNAAFIRQGGTCFYCGAPIWLHDPTLFARRYGITQRLAARLQCTGEHLLARQDGGDCSRQNIVAACRFCNKKRHERKRAPHPDVYQALVQRRMRRRKWHPLDIHRLLTAAQDGTVPHDRTSSSRPDGG